MSQRHIAVLFVSALTIAACATAGASQTTDGWPFFDQNNLTAARAAFISETETHPSDISAWQGLAVIDWMEDKTSAAAELAQVIRRAPDDPRAWTDWQLYLGNASNYGSDSETVPLIQFIASNEKAPTQLRASAVEALAENDRIRGDIAGACAIWNKLDYVKAWDTIGPFDNVSKSGFKKRFEPETVGVDLNAHVAGKNDLPLQWRTLPLVRDDGQCEVGRFLGDSGSSVYYSATSVDSPANQTLTLWLSPTGATKLWINGQIVLSDDVYRGHDYTVGDTFSLAVQLKAGPNTILIKTADDEDISGAFMLRFTDAGGTRPVRLGVDPSNVSPEPPASATTALPTFDPVIVGLAEKAPANRQNIEALALLQQDYYDYDAAEKSMQKAVALAPNDAWLTWENAAILDDLGQQDDFDSARDAARTAEPDNLIAQENYIDDQNTKISDDDKLTLIRSLLAHHPASPLLLSSLARTYQDQKLSQQCINYFLKAYHLAPGPGVAESISAAYANLNRLKDQAIFDHAALLKFPGDQVLLSDLAGNMDSQLKTVQSVSLYQKAITFGGNKVEMLDNISGAYADAHQAKDAINALAQEAALRPEDAYLRGELADLYSDSGQKATAIAVYQQAIALDPSQISLRKKEEALLGNKPVMDIVPALPAAPLIAAAKKTTPSPQAAVRNIVDEAREVVYSDGATDENIHEVLQILDQSAVDQYSTYELDANTATCNIANVRARLIKASGNIIYPKIDDDATEVDFPSLAVGDIIDVNYEVSDYQSGALAHNFWCDWYFDGKGTDVDVSQFSLITPKNMQFTTVRHGNAPQNTEQVTGDWAVRQWKMTNVPATPVESESACSRDIGDWVDISTVGSWKTIINWYSDLANSAVTPDDTVRAKAAELTAGDTTDDQKIKHIVRFVRSLQYQSTPFRKSAYIPTDGKEVIRELYGDCKDKAALLCSLLNCAGIQAQMILLSPRSSGITPLLPSPRFDHAIARIDTSNGWQWVDATADQLQYGYLPYVDQGVPALVIDPTQTDITTSPVEGADFQHQTCTYKIALKGDGSMSGTIDANYVGDIAWIFRSAVRKLGIDNQSQMVQGVLGEMMPGSSSDGGAFDGIKDPDGPLSFAASYHEDSYAASAGNLLLIKLPWAGSMIRVANLITGPPKRTTPLEMGASCCTQTRIVEITMPPGYAPDSLEPSTKLTSNWGECDFDYSSSGQVITAAQTIRIDPLRVSAADLPGFLKFVNQIEAECDKQIVIKSGV